MANKVCPTLCWDCANAVGHICPWAYKGKPVKGWTARRTVKPSQGEGEYSYLVIDCPLFKRDAVRGGLYRYKEGDIVCDSTSGRRGK